MSTPLPTGVRSSSATRVSPSVTESADVARSAACRRGSPRPSATTASCGGPAPARRPAARSHPATRTTVGVGDPARLARPASARSSMRSMISPCQRVATMPSRQAGRVDVHVGLARRRPRPSRLTGRLRRVDQPSRQLVAHPVPLGPQVAQVLRGLRAPAAPPGRRSAARSPPGRPAWPGCWSAAAWSGRRGRRGSARRCRSRGRRPAGRARRLASTVSAPWSCSW